VEEYIRHDEVNDRLMAEGKEPEDEVLYDRFISTVAGSFSEFCDMLRRAP
jgi:hypothetical protein